MNPIKLALKRAVHQLTDAAIDQGVDAATRFVARQMQKMNEESAPAPVEMPAGARMSRHEHCAACGGSMFYRLTDSPGQVLYWCPAHDQNSFFTSVNTAELSEGVVFGARP